MLRSATRREDWVLLRDTSPDGWGPPSPPSAPPLTRQPSIRRLPARSRTVDFTDFTSRRRSSGREGNNRDVPPGAEPEADDSAAQTFPWSPLSPNTTSVPPRRFFPSRRPELPWSPIPESASASASTGTGLGMGTGPVPTPSTRSSPAPSTATMTPTHAADTRLQRTFLSWLPSSALLSLPPPPPADLRSPRTTPRLRRGGVRPPESLLGRPHVTMLRTTSPEPLASPNPIPLPADVGTGASASASVGSMERESQSGGVPSSSSDVPTVDAPRAQSPTAAE